MADLGDLVQKAIYLGVGMADYAAERAGMTFKELKSQAQKVADEMVARGEMSVEEARRYVDELIQEAQEAQVKSHDQSQSTDNEPRLIEIVVEDEPETTEKPPESVDDLKKQLEKLQEELRNLEKK